jgi:hypothetical protein
VALSPSRRGYAFQHAVTEYFLELGFIAQEEHPATRTDICLTHPPLEIAVECKHVEEGVTLDHVYRFDERLKLWQSMQRPCLGVMVATHFRLEAKRLCEEKNILCITQAQIEDALARKRESRPETILPVSSKTVDLLKAFSGLLTDWIPHLFGDPVDANSLFLKSLLVLEYVTDTREILKGKLALSYSEKGLDFFSECKTRLNLLQEIENPYSTAEQIGRGITDVLADWHEGEYGIHDKILLLGLGILEEKDGGLKPSNFAEDLSRLVSNDNKN